MSDLLLVTFNIFKNIRNVLEELYILLTPDQQFLQIFPDEF